MSFTTFRYLVQNNFETWRRIRLADLQFWHRSDAQLMAMALTALVVLLLAARSALTRRPGRHRLVVPAVFASIRPSYASMLRHVPLAVFVVGLPFLMLALADPFTSLVASEVTYPGRRIAIMIDASSSMRVPFTAAHLNQRGETDATFFTAVAAAERFVQMRVKGKYRDLLALVEFGNEAYVVTPFTSDYDNILLSTSLIGDPVEFSMFPDQGTIIGQAINQSIGLFKAFKFLDAAGNLMVIFSDGEDTNAIINGRPLDDIMRASMDAKIPVYLVRTSYERSKGRVIPDSIWMSAIEKTGGRFYAADSEESLLNAIKEIDQFAAGSIQTRQYSSQQPQFAMFAFVTAACWFGAAGLKLTVPGFQKLP